MMCQIATAKIFLATKTKVNAFIFLTCILAAYKYYNNYYAGEHTRIILFVYIIIFTISYTKQPA